MPEQAALLRKAADSLRGARLLANDGLNGFAASRAYYTMFYIAEDLLLSEGLTFSKHSAVIAAFGQHFAHTGRVPQAFHQFLIEAQSKRHSGDYELGPTLTAEQAGEQIDRAAQFIALAQRLLDPQPSDQMELP